MAGQYQRKAAQKSRGAGPATQDPNPGSLTDNHMSQQIAQWFGTVKFRKTLFGGLDEGDLWKKMNELHALYDKALIAERGRYDGLLQAQARAHQEALDAKDRELEALSRQCGELYQAYLALTQGTEGSYG